MCTNPVEHVHIEGVYSMYNMYICRRVSQRYLLIAAGRLQNTRSATLHGSLPVCMSCVAVPAFRSADATLPECVPFACQAPMALDGLVLQKRRAPLVDVLQSHFGLLRHYETANNWMECDCAVFVESNVRFTADDAMGKALRQGIVRFCSPFLWLAASLQHDH